MKNTFLSISAVIALSLPQAAQAKSTSDFLTELDARVGVTSVSEINLGGDDLIELLVHTKFCEEYDPDVCAWIVATQVNGTWAVVNGSSSKTLTVGRNSQGERTIFADGTEWHWDGRMLHPGDGVLYDVGERPATPDEFRMVVRATDAGYDQADLRVYVANLSGNAANEKVVLVRGTQHRIGTWGIPYMIFNGDGSLVSEGFSSDLPRVFPKQDGGYSVIEIHPHQLVEYMVR